MSALGGKRVDIRDIIRAPKRISSGGKWSAGTMPRTAFPLSRSGNKAYRLGNRRWRVVTFEALGMNCRLLVNYHPTLSQYQAMLGVEMDGDIKVLATLEHHPTHNAWHAHLCCDPIAAAPSGIRRGPWVRIMKAKGARHRSPTPQADDVAFSRAAAFFRLGIRDDGGLL